MSRYDGGPEHAGIDRLRAQIGEAPEVVLKHPIYRRLDTLQDVNTFVGHREYAVRDSMSLLKNLQRHLTCVEVPWVPRGTTASRRLINDQVIKIDGGRLAAFRDYLARHMEVDGEE